MPQADNGYATILIVGLMSALSVIAVSVMNLSTMQAKKNIKLQNQLETDTYLESVFNNVMGDILSHKLKFDVSTPIIQRILDNQSFSVTAEFESSKTNLNAIQNEKIHASIRALMPANDNWGDLVENIHQVVQSHGLIQNFKDINFSNSDTLIPIHCLREQFTIFSSNAPFDYDPRRGTISDGAILRLIISPNSPSSKRVLDATVLFTGIKSEPYWVLDWTRAPTYSEEECA